MSTRLAGGRNIAMKVPPHQYDATVAFYRDVVGLKPLDNHPPAVGFQFGANQLWIDKVPAMSQAELWLELVADDVPAAAKHLEAAGVVRCDEIEPLPEGSDAFWISNPASIIHIVSRGEYRTQFAPPIAQETAKSARSAFASRHYRNLLTPRALVSIHAGFAPTFLLLLSSTVFGII